MRDRAKSYFWKSTQTPERPETGALLFWLVAPLGPVFGPLRRLRRHGCGALFLLRPSLRACKKQTVAPAPLRLFLPQAAPQLRSPARVGGSPLRRCAPALPEGEPSARPWTEENFVVRRTFLRLCLTTNFAVIDAGTLGSSRGGASEKHKYTKPRLPAPQNAPLHPGTNQAEKIGSKEKKAKTKNL